MFWFFNLGQLNCGFDFGLTMAFDAAVLLRAHLSPFGFCVAGPGLSMRPKYGVVFGILWLISFSAAWWIVYLGFKSRLAVSPN